MFSYNTGSIFIRDYLSYTEHLGQRNNKRQNTKTMILSGMVGGAILLIADMLARTLYAAEIPISILTTVIGVPVLVWFMCVRKERRV